MTQRATLRGAERTPLDERADVLICGASFAGLAVARELAGSGADVLIVDRYEIGERQTSACAAPTPWLHKMGVERSIRQEIPCMAFHTPHGSSALPAAVELVELRLPGASATRSGSRPTRASRSPRSRPRDGDTVLTDRGTLHAPLIVDALGWRRILGPGANVQPPEAAISAAWRSTRTATATDLDVWIDRSLIRHGYAWSVPADGEQRVGVGSYQPRDHVKEPTKEIARRLERDAVRYQGNWFPHRLRPATEDGVFFVGDSAGHCLPLSGEGIRTAFYFGIAAGRSCGRAGRRADARAGAGATTARSRAATLGRSPTRWPSSASIPRLPPKALTALLARAGTREAMPARL